MTAPDPVKAAPKTAASATGLNKKINGVPLWGWGILVAGAIVVVYAVKSRSARTSAAAAASQEVAQGGGYTPVGYMPQTTTAESTRILTNQDWSIAAQKWLVQQGHDPAESADAVQNYIANSELTAGQRKLISEALKAIGPLPEGRSGSAAVVSPLHTPKDGNILGQILYGIADVAGLDEPNNPLTKIFGPLVNNFIDSGPISGAFQTANDALGGDVNLNLSPQVTIPGVGTIGGNANIGNNALGGGISLPNIGIPTPFGTIGLGGGGSGSVAPNTRDAYLGNYIVQQGDTLASISKKYYGGSGGATVIYSANLNKIPNPARLTPGTVLQIPALGSNA